MCVFLFRIRHTFRTEIQKKKYKKKKTTNYEQPISRGRTKKNLEKQNDHTVTIKFMWMFKAYNTD